MEKKGQKGKEGVGKNVNCDLGKFGELFLEGIGQK